MIVQCAVNIVSTVHVMRPSHGMVQHVHVMVVLVVQVHTPTWMVRAWIVHHIERIVLLVGHSSVLVMTAMHVVVCVVRHVMRCVMTLQMLVVVNKLVVIIASIAKGRKIGIKGAHFMETVGIIQIVNYMEISWRTGNKIELN